MKPPHSLPPPDKVEAPIPMFDLFPHSIIKTPKMSSMNTQIFNNMYHIHDMVGTYAIGG
jgi:hypothetical protein